jgi:DNA-binding NarL/FixJ family response regulator
MNEAIFGGSPTPIPPVKRRVLIVDDHPLVRRGLTALIDNEADLVVCADIGMRREALALIAASRPDLVVADLPLRGGDALALVKEIRSGHAGLPVLVLTMHASPVWARRALGAGASGYVTKQEMDETLLIAIRRVLDGGRFVSAGLGAGLDGA